MDVTMNKYTLFSIKQLIKGNSLKSTASIGAHAEHIASQFLLKNKLQLIEKNYHCRQGEIDLIMQDKHELVFVEVRYRKLRKHGNAIETIQHHKLKRIQTAINHYIMTNNLGYIPCRIDVIGLHGNLQQPDINWVKNIIID